MRCIRSSSNCTSAYLRTQNATKVWRPTYPHILHFRCSSHGSSVTPCLLEEVSRRLDSLSRRATSATMQKKTQVKSEIPSKKHAGA